jgi:hypothetical protein
VRKIAIATLALGAVVSSFGTIPSASAATSADGRRCSFGSTTNPGAEPDTQTGQIQAGPAVINDGGTPPGVHSGHFVCTIQVSASTHAGPDAASVTGPDTTGVIAAQGQVTYTAGDDAPVYLCTEIVVDGQSWYYDDPTVVGATGTWTTSSSASCGLATSLDPGNDPTVLAIEGLIDAIICPVLAIVFPPEGDVTLPDPVGKVWDCPPYDA